MAGHVHLRRPGAGAVFAGNLAIKPATTAVLRRWRLRTVMDREAGDQLRG